jgi:hypothetical protein
MAAVANAAIVAAEAAFINLHLDAINNNSC